MVDTDVEKGGDPEITTLDSLERKIKTLSEVAWEGECDWPAVLDWLSGFTGASGQSQGREGLEMLYLLSNFLYFGRNEILVLLRSLYRDVFRYRIIAEARKRANDTTDRAYIDAAYSAELERTRFLPMGNPSESSSHLLYFFRQQNDLPKGLFLNVHDALGRGRQGAPTRLRFPEVQRYVFLDDFAGSGQQALSYSRDVVAEMRSIKSDLDICYYVLFATTDACERIQKQTEFNEVACVLEISEDFKAFSPDSLVYRNAPDGVSSRVAKEIATYYGSQLLPTDPLGFDGGELMLGFRHNVPDNTLPVFWARAADGSWAPPFPRFHKKYGWAAA